jgi:hypothetical protein
VFYFRDIAFYYFPNYVFLEQELRRGVWPLWNPWSEGGARFLVVYPPDLLLVALLGARGALAVGPPLHVLLAMWGAALLAGRLGAGTWGRWAAGWLFGASGFMLSTLNLFELSHGAALAPWVVAAAIGLTRSPGPRSAAQLALLAALQASTLSAEMVGATAVIAAVLALPARRRAFVWAGLGALVAALVAAPALLGARALVAGSQRASGFDAAVSLAWSLHPVALADVALPRFFGDVHTFSDSGFWGQTFFTGGYPYLLSLYAGFPTLLLAAGARAGALRLWGIVILGVVVGSGSHGPLAAPLAELMRFFRTPVKFFVLVALPLALLAGLGLDAVRRGQRFRPLSGLLPVSLLLLAALAVARWPAASLALLARLLPGSPVAAWPVVAQLWPQAFLVCGLLSLGTVLALLGGRRTAPLAGLLAGCDLLIANASINTLAPADFYELRPAVRRLIERAHAGGRYRCFSYGAEATPGLAWSPAAALRNSDVALFTAERQSLLPRTPLLDGLEAAFDEDRVGWAPRGSTLRPDERRPARIGEHLPLLRLANVRFVLSFAELPRDALAPVGEAVLEEILEPLRLYEVRDALPRAFWVGRAEVAADQARALAHATEPGFDPRRAVVLEAPATVLAPAQGAGRVAYQALDAHTVRLRVSSPPGWVVVLDGHDAAWRSAGGEPVLRAYGRYRAIATPGGERTFTLRFQPPWRGPSLAAATLGALALAGLMAGRPARLPRA